MRILAGIIASIEYNLFHNQLLNFVKGAEFGECENRPFGRPCKIRILANSSSLVQTAFIKCLE